jgi:hypothetical protein
MRVWIAFFVALNASVSSFAQIAPSKDKPPEIMLLHMGGADCPPCTAWRAAELPKFQAMDVSKKIKFYKVNKSLPSSVPPKFWLHDDLKPLKDELDRASGGQRGSAQTIIVVDGKVFDYIHGSHSADDLKIIFESLLAGKESPFPRCVTRRNGYCSETIQPKS